MPIPVILALILAGTATGVAGTLAISNTVRDTLILGAVGVGAYWMIKK